MLNKPINPNPYFKTVDGGNAINFGFKVQNANITNSIISIFDAEDDNYIETVIPTNTPDGNGTIVNGVLEGNLENGKDYYWYAEYSEPMQGAGKEVSVDWEQNSYNSFTLNFDTENSIYQYENTGTDNTDYRNPWNGTLYAIHWSDYAMLIKQSDSSLSGVFYDIQKSPTNYILKIDAYRAHNRTDGIEYNEITYHTIENIELFSDYYKITVNSELPDIYGDSETKVTLSVYKITDANSYNIEPGGFIQCDSVYHSISSVTSQNNVVVVSLASPCINKPNPTVYYPPGAQYNISPGYYFRARKTPTFNINIENDVKSDNVDEPYIPAPYLKFNVTYEQSNNIKLDYYYYLIRDDNDNKIIYKSSIIKETGVSLVYHGLANNKQYKIECIGVDGESNVITTEAIISTGYYNFLDYSSDPRCLNNFKISDTSLNIFIYGLLSGFMNFQIVGNLVLYLYKIQEGCNTPKYVGKFLYDNDNDNENKIYDFQSFMADFNVANFTKYNYMAYIETAGGEAVGGALFPQITTNFNCGIIAPIKIDDLDEGLEFGDGWSHGDYYINPDDIWSLNLKLNSDVSQQTTNLNREKIEGFGKYYKFIKGDLESISSSESYLLGDINKADCEYDETTFLRKRWKNLVQDGNPKFYRPYVGEPMVIDIESYSLQPYIFGGLFANEVQFNYAQTENPDNMLQIQIIA